MQLFHTKIQKTHLNDICFLLNFFPQHVRVVIVIKGKTVLVQYPNRDCILFHLPYCGSSKNTLRTNRSEDTGLACSHRHCSGQRGTSDHSLYCSTAETSLELLSPPVHSLCPSLNFWITMTNLPGL